MITALIDRVPAHRSVTARGWRIAKLPNRLYPGLVRDGSHAPGRLYTDLTACEWTTLDAFEDPGYTLTAIEVLPGPRPALTYVWADEHLSSAWTIEDFSVSDLTKYLQRCKAWRQRYEQND